MAWSAAWNMYIEMSEYRCHEVYSKLTEKWYFAHGGLSLIEARCWLWTVASCQLLSQRIEMVDEPVPTWKNNDTYLKNVKLWVSWGCDSGNLLLFAKDIQNIATHAVSELLAIPNWQKNDNLQNIYYEACCLDPRNWILDSGLWSSWLAWISEREGMWNIPATNYCFATWNCPNEMKTG